MEFWLLKLDVRPKQYFEFDIPVLDYFCNLKKYVIVTTQVQTKRRHSFKIAYLTIPGQLNLRPRLKVYY